MATYLYVGSMAKNDGKVDVKFGNEIYTDIIPGETEIIVEGDTNIPLEQAIDPFDGTYLYIKIS